MTPEEEKALLLRIVLRLARTQLEKQDGFIPFGATLGSNRDVQLLMPKSAKGGTMTIEKVDTYWTKQMAAAIKAGNVKALCTLADVREADDSGKLVPAIFIHIEHSTENAEDLLYRYERLENSQVTLQEPARETTAPQFFAQS